MRIYCNKAKNCYLDIKKEEELYTIFHFLSIRKAIGQQVLKKILDLRNKMGKV